MSGPALLSVMREDGVASISLNRPNNGNALTRAMLQALSATLDQVAATWTTRCVLLRAIGPMFCAGFDADDTSEAESRPEAHGGDTALGPVIVRLDALNKPTIALVHGAADGAGLGLLAACDIVLAADDARFTLVDPTLNIPPPAAMPAILGAMGRRAAGRYALTGESLSALEAHRLGLVHEVLPAHMLNAAGQTMIGKLLSRGAAAQERAKSLSRSAETVDGTTLWHPQSNPDAHGCTST